MVALSHVVTAVPVVPTCPVAVVGCPGGPGGSSGWVTLPLPGSSSWKPRAGNGICPFSPKIRDQEREHGAPCPLRGCGTEFGDITRG